MRKQIGAVICLNLWNVTIWFVFFLLSSLPLFIFVFVFSLSMSHCSHSISLFYIIIQEWESQTQSKYLWTVKAGAVEQRRWAGQCWSSNRRRRQDGSFSRGRRHGVGSKMGLSLSLSRLSLSFLFFFLFFSFVSGFSVWFWSLTNTDC